jgi:hypothetical protein
VGVVVVVVAVGVVVVVGGVAGVVVAPVVAGAVGELEDGVVVAPVVVAAGPLGADGLAIGCAGVAWAGGGWALGVAGCRPAPAGALPDGCDDGDTVEPLPGAPVTAPAEPGGTRPRPPWPLPGPWRWPMSSTAVGSDPIGALRARGSRRRSRTVGAPPSSRSRAAGRAARPPGTAPSDRMPLTSVPFSPGWIGL